METHSSLYDINSITVPIPEIEEGEIIQNVITKGNQIKQTDMTKNGTYEGRHSQPDHEEENEGVDAAPARKSDLSTEKERLNSVAKSDSSQDHVRPQSYVSRASFGGTQPIKRGASEERPPLEKKQDLLFAFPNCPPPRISRMSSLTPEEHERLQSVNAKKIEAVKLTMNEASISIVRTKRPSSNMDTTTPPKKRGRPKGSVNKPRMNGAQSSISHVAIQPRRCQAGPRIGVTARTIATQSCLDLTEQGFPHRSSAIFRPSSHVLDSVTKDGYSSQLQNEKMSDTVGCERTIPKPSKGNTEERNRAKRSTSSIPSGLCSKAARSETNTEVLEDVPSDDGCVTPPLCIVEDASNASTTSHETPKPARQLKAKSRKIRFGKDVDAWLQTLIDELNSLLPSSEDEEKLKIACGLQRLISEQREFQHLTSMITLLETEVNERFQQRKEEVDRLLDDHVEKRVDNGHKIADELDKMRTTFESCCDSVNQTAAELNAKLENLRRETEEIRNAYIDHRSQRFSSISCLAALLPPPPPPPPQPPLHSREDHREDETSTPENASSKNKQRSSNRGMDTHEASTSASIPVIPAVNNAVNQSPLLPLPAPFYGPLLPPPQKMMYDYFQLHQLQQMQSMVPPLPPFIPNMLLDGSQIPLPFQPPSHDHPNARIDGYNKQRHHSRGQEHSDYANRSRR
ncbi:hypothetical protein RB195_001109 [Necator americanus]|uniref:Uncharacterized protein n=1 Tax=Necator americanus TaxID=51031 RepID=A0ABR1DCQ6_NECAM